MGYTPRVNHWDYEDEAVAWRVCDSYRAYGKVSWVKGSVVYWIEDSTD